ncbi:MAG: SGNH/GDSL hydrolase family protein [Xanthobacteraceae bacterium]
MAFAAAGILSLTATVGTAGPSRIACGDAVKLTHLARPLNHFSTRLAHGDPVTILAIGSSSTAGTGASRIEFNYPSRLEAELHRLLPNARLRVLNHGIGGEDAIEMLVRIGREMVSEKPDLVLWQVGTNALLREQGVGPQAVIIREGLRRIREGGADAVLIDPQFAPKVLRDPDARPMVALLAKLADDAGVPVFRRFALMEYWHEVREIAFADILSPDLFHMNDWSYGCFAASLAAALKAAISPPAGEPAKEVVSRPKGPAAGSDPVTHVSAPR